MAVQSRNLGRLDDSQRYISQAMRYLDTMTERERYSARAFFFRLTADYQQCVKENGELLARYSADIVGHNGLALCASQLRDLRRARNEMAAVVKLLPNRALFRDNLALYSDYAGDFQAGEQEARKVGDNDVYALLALAFAQSGQARLSDAQDTYAKLRTINANGASLAASGLGDLATLQGRFSDAVRILQEGAVADLASKNSDRAAAKFVAVAYAESSRGDKRSAVAAALKALKSSNSPRIRFLAARAFITADEVKRAREIGSGLAAEPQPESRAYAKIIEGDTALKTGDAAGTIRPFNEANALLDTWIGHFDLGRAYLATGALIQADSEFDRCLQRRGEALALFLDEEPTFAYLPPVYYYQGRVREALKTDRYTDSYSMYLNFRGDSVDDPLVRELRKASPRPVPSGL
jgi:eukaryotic-like serine/threonine-protein kinase